MNQEFSLVYPARIMPYQSYQQIESWKNITLKSLKKAASTF